MMAVVWGLLLLALFGIAGCAQDSKAPGAKGQAATVTVAKPEWFTCESDADCMSEEGVCNSMSAVNRLFRGPFVQYRDAMNKQLGCKATPTVSNTGIQTGCVNSRCVIKPGAFRKPGTP